MKSVAMAIVVRDDEFLMVLRRFPPSVWGPPAGYAEKGESFEQAAIRETLEETGIVCSSIGFLGTVDYKKHHTQLQLYACEFISGSCRCSFESKDLGWFDIDNLPEPFSPSKEIMLRAKEMVRQSGKKAGQQEQQSSHLGQIDIL